MKKKLMLIIISMFMLSATGCSVFKSEKNSDKEKNPTVQDDTGEDASDKEDNEDSSTAPDGENTDNEADSGTGSENSDKDEDKETGSTIGGNQANTGAKSSIDNTFTGQNDSADRIKRLFNEFIYLLYDTNYGNASEASQVLASMNTLLLNPEIGTVAGQYKSYLNSKTNVKINSIQVTDINEIIAEIKGVQYDAYDIIFTLVVNENGKEINMGELSATFTLNEGYYKLVSIEVW